MDKLEQRKKEIAEQERIAKESESLLAKKLSENSNKSDALATDKASIETERQKLKAESDNLQKLKEQLEEENKNLKTQQGN